MQTHLALGELGLDSGPGLGLGGVAEQVHDDGAARDGLVDLEEVLAGDPAVLLGILPGLAVLPHADDDVQAVVAQVQALAVALGAVADEGEGVVLEVLLGWSSTLLSPGAALKLLRGLKGKGNGVVCGWVTHQELLLGPVGTLYKSYNYTP